MTKNIKNRHFLAVFNNFAPPPYLKHSQYIIIDSIRTFKDAHFEHLLTGAILMTFQKIHQNFDLTPKMTIFHISIPYFHIFAKMVDKIKKKL